MPYTRGAEFSRSSEEIFKRQPLVENGVKEITLFDKTLMHTTFKIKGFQI